MLSKILEPAWSEIQSSAETLGQKIEPTIRKGVGPVLEAKQKVKDKILGTLYQPIQHFPSVGHWRKHSLSIQCSTGL